MIRYLPLLLLVAVSAPAAVSKPGAKRETSRGRSAFSESAVNNIAVTTPVHPGSIGAAVLRAQILLDRAHFSCGEIDGSYGRNLEMAIRNYQQAHALEVTGKIGANMWKDLNSDDAPALFSYTIAPEDVAGPFDKDPPLDMMEKAKLESLPYASPADALAERFHVSQQLLRKLNRGKSFDEAGTQILVPNVIVAAPGKAASVLVDGATRTVQALDADGKVIASYAATVGSEHDPLPVGDWKVTIVQKNPVFFYNSDLFWDADEQHAKAKVPPGPRNPVGMVWIGLSKEHYGIHGTPAPQNIGHTQSHGCIRLTNWDAAELAQMVRKGTPALLKD
ncbi:MAG: L,D-transpeptidase [Acidobacteriota bacterium]|nr:L,D-transpeptidase [Acidobacteriota bacterium]